MDIAPELLEQIVAHARAEAPNECCGVVAVIPASEGRQAQAMRVRAARNVHASPKRFEIDGKDVVAGDRRVRRGGLGDRRDLPLPHPHGALPVADRHQLRGQLARRRVDHRGARRPTAPEIRSYLIEEGTVREVEIGQIAV